MVTNQQVRRLKSMKNIMSSIDKAAMKAGMCEKTARKYLKEDKLPSELKQEHNWETRKDPFGDVWEEITDMLKINSGLEAKTIFENLTENYPDKFQEGQLRSLQRKIKKWRAIYGSSKNVSFPQLHPPGRLCQSDFTDMSALGITIEKVPFEHLYYHFVLTYSNWETGTLCFSENFESLSEGLQNALWRLGYVPERHRSDNLTAAVHNLGERKGDFKTRYKELLEHYGLQGEHTQPSSPNENGDVEQRHYRFKKAVEQALMLRGSKEFKSRNEYQNFIIKLFDKLNRNRKDKLKQEIKNMRQLPFEKLDTKKELKMTVGPSSTINLLHNTYSVDSKLIGEEIKTHVYADEIKILYANRCIDTFPRLRGSGRHRINYCHIIDSLARKPGAFEHFRYKDDLFPSSTFRMAYDLLKENYPKTGHKKYIKILLMAKNEGEDTTENALKILLENPENFSTDNLQNHINISGENSTAVLDVNIPLTDISQYDKLISEEATNE